MNHLVIYAHPNPKSFSNAIRHTVVKTLREKGETVEEIDLYAMGFQPVLSGSDLAAAQKGGVVPEIQQEQARITRSDRLVVIFPLWWGGMPAILKGYFDRVLTHGFAFKAGRGGVQGLLAGKSVALVTATGGSKKDLAQLGVVHSINALDQSVFGFCGMEILEHHFFFGVPGAGAEGRAAMLTETVAFASRLA